MSDATLEVLGIAGSLRSGSYNRGLIRAAGELAPSGMRIEPADLTGIPLFDSDVEAEGDPRSVSAFKSAIQDADALLIATPEYQHSFPGVLKNALDWASRPAGSAPLDGKPVAILGATPGRGGTARAQAALRQVLVYNGCLAVTKPEVQVFSAHEKFDENGELVDEETRRWVSDLLEALQTLARRLA